MRIATPKQARFLTRYGPWAVVTGASSGIGKALATRLAEAGVNLVLAARNRAELDNLGVALSDRCGVECRVCVVDLAAETGTETLGAATRDLDVGLLVAAAGFGTSGLFLDSQIETELEMLSVNCRSAAALTWYFGRRFVARGRGGVVLLSSIVAFQGTPYAANYSATKAYIQALVEGLRTEFALKGVDVLAAAPGPTASGFAARAGMTMGKALNPDAIAQPILAALGRRTTVLPGFLSKLLRYSLTGLPRGAKVAIMGRVMKGMARRE